MRTKLQITFVLLLSIVLLNCCTYNRYLLSEDSRNQKLLIDEIKSRSKEGSISRRPMIVINETPYRFDVELKRYQLPITSDEIISIEVLENEIASLIYKGYADNGVLLITTDSFSKDFSVTENEGLGRVLPLIGKMEINYSYIEEVLFRDRSKLAEPLNIELLGVKQLSLTDLLEFYEKEKHNIKNIDVIKIEKIVRLLTLNQYDSIILVTPNQ